MLITFGISLVITQSKIFAPIRTRIAKISTFLGDLVKCIMCTGFWIGLFLSLFLNIGINSVHNVLIRITLDGFATSGFVWFVYVILYRYFQDPVED